MEVSEALAAQIASHMGEGASAEQVHAVLAAFTAVRNGAALGTVVRSAEGAVCHRVDAEGVQLWRCSGPSGEQWSDMQPTLDWAVIYSPAE